MMNKLKEHMKGGAGGNGKEDPTQEAVDSGEEE